MSLLREAPRCFVFSPSEGALVPPDRPSWSPAHARRTTPVGVTWACINALSERNPGTRGDVDLKTLEAVRCACTVSPRSNHGLSERHSPWRNPHFLARAVVRVQGRRSAPGSCRISEPPTTTKPAGVSREELLAPGLPVSSRRRDRSKSCSAPTLNGDRLTLGTTGARHVAMSSSRSRPSE